MELDLKQALRNLVDDRLDRDLLAPLVAATGLTRRAIVQELDAQGLAHGFGATRPPPTELDLSAQALIERARDQGAALGAATGLAGALGVPPEVLGSMVQLLRLAQRMAVVYGVDPETDAGGMVTWRAIAAAYQLQVPDQAELTLRVRDLPRAAMGRLRTPQPSAAWAAQHLVASARAAIMARGIRAVPGLATAWSAWAARGRIQEQGERMQRVFRDAGAPRNTHPIVDVQELDP